MSTCVIPSVYHSLNLLYHIILHKPEIVSLKTTGFGSTESDTYDREFNYQKVDSSLCKRVPV